MQMFTKIQTRSAARSATFGQKVVDNWQGLPEHLKGVNNGQDSTKRWGRSVDIEVKEKEQAAPLTCLSVKDWRKPWEAKQVKVQVKKLKELEKHLK